MDRQSIIAELEKYFKVSELVCKHTYQKHGENSWEFLDTTLLHTLLVLRRDILKVPLVCNDYMSGGSFTQRGLRCNCCALVKSKTSPYLSMHLMGKGVDLVSSQMTADKMRDLIKINKDKLPYPVRIEKDVNWLHIDTRNYGLIKVVEFRG